MLYERDYNVLTDEEIKQWDKAEKLKDKCKGKGLSIEVFFKYHDIMPKAVVHHKKLFPNNFLHIDEIKNTEKIERTIDELFHLLDNNANEREILNYIRDNKTYFVVGAIFQYGFIPFNFGHHEAFLFREFSLGTNYVVDFLLVGKNSGGYEFIFIELESPKGAITKNDGEFGDVIRKGVSQVKDWSRWLEGNYSSLQSEFEKHLGSYNRNLPKEFYKLDKSRLHYVVVAGRRNDYKEKTYTLRREYFKENNITILHYDNLLDSIVKLKRTGNY